MDPRTSQAFRDELEKIADELADVRKKLSPGDILVGHLRGPSLGGALVGKALSLFQEGTKHYHAAMYVGTDQVIDINPGTGVKKRTLKEFSDRYKFKALGVKAPQEIKDEAAAYAKKQVGKGYDMIGALRQALPARKDPGPRARQEGLDSFFCSQLVSNAYAKLPLAKNRFVGDVRPVDLQKSTITKTIGEVT